jgi:uncharacterized membrane protein
MFETLIGLAAIVVLFVIMTRQQSRLNLLQRELATLRGLVLSNLPASNPGAALAREVVAQEKAEETEAGRTSPVAAATGSGGEASGISGDAAVVTAAGAPPAEDSALRPEEADKTPSRPQGPSKRPDIETALGTRWAVWVGGLALALGGVFLVRYTIESGVFGPELRLIMAAAFGLLLVGAGEFIRRTGYRVPVEEAAAAYIPAILTAAGAFTLFGTVYAAHAIYGFIGPTAAFVLLGLIGMATIAAALVHGLALAGIGLLGALATPLLIDSQAPNAWALFGYLAIVLVATGFVARIRAWSFLMAGAFVGVGLWTLFYVGAAVMPDFRIVLFIGIVTLLVLAFAWFGRSSAAVASDAGFDWPSIAPAFFVGLSSVALALDPAFQGGDGTVQGAALVVAMLLVAVYRVRALPLLHAAGLAVSLIYLAALPGAMDWTEFSSASLAVDGTPVSLSPDRLTWVGAALAILFVSSGFWTARRLVRQPWHSASWAGWGVAVPLFVLLTLWVGYGNIDVDFSRAALAALLTVAFAAAAEWIARAEQPPLQGGPAVSATLAGAGLALLLCLHMAFGSGMTTVLAGAAAILPALATRRRIYPALGWLSVGALVAVIGRVAFDPTIVGAQFLSTTPVFNWLLPGYGVPALAFGFAAWQLARTTNGRLRLAMEAGAALFALLTVAMLVRHAMHGGVIDAGALTLAEQSIYTLIALGFAAILVAIDSRSPSSVLRYGSLGIGVLSVLSIAGNHFLWLNPLFTDESTGGIAVFNLLFLAYLLPALTAGGLALYARGKRPRWYSAMLALVAALLAFAYATLSIRRIFKGEFIGLWSGLGQLETYSYSALWLVLGVVLLVLGVMLASQVLRIASAALIAVAVLKVFLFDMSELEGVLRALSFIGLGAVLIGIGLFYQRLLTRAKPREVAEAS